MKKNILNFTTSDNSTSIDKKISYLRGQEMLRKGWISPKVFNEMVEEGAIAGPRGAQSKYSFQDTDMTFYPQSLIIKKSKAKDANNVYIPFFDTAKAMWKEAMEATHKKIIEAAVREGVVTINE